MFHFYTKPYEHQKKALELSADKEQYALLMEMGTGKSKVIVDNAVYLFQKGRINSVLIVAPKGVHSKWVHHDFPLSVDPSIEWKGGIWRSGDVKSISSCERLFDRGEQLRVLSVNIDIFSSPKSPGVTLVKKFLLATDCLMVIDESTRIKNPTASRTKTLLKLSDMAKYKRILTGTPITNNVFDLYSQFLFLDPSVFGQSFISFKHTYAEILDQHDPLMRKIMSRGARFAPIIVAKDSNGRPKFKNLDKLQALISPHSFRVTKEECLDLPPKIYETIEYDLEPNQQRIYSELKEKARVELLDETVTVSHKMILLMRLQQVIGGYLPNDDKITRPLFADPEDNPRIKALKEILEDIDHQVIIWCRFQEEIRQLEKIFAGTCVTYYGETKNREHALELFTTGQVQYFIGNAATGGVGLNLTNANTVIYYSNDFSLENRLQSEDRAHRIGQHKSVVYFDIQANNTIDKYIIEVLRSKKNLSEDFLKSIKEGL
jgi:SNF2 family DNA or RNA helicase